MLFLCLSFSLTHYYFLFNLLFVIIYYLLFNLLVIIICYYLIKLKNEHQINSRYQASDNSGTES